MFSPFLQAHILDQKPLFCMVILVHNYCLCVTEEEPLRLQKSLYSLSGVCVLNLLRSMLASGRRKDVEEGKTRKKEGRRDEKTPVNKGIRERKRMRKGRGEGRRAKGCCTERSNYTIDAKQ